MTHPSPPPVSYATAGVDTDKADALVNHIQSLTKNRKQTNAIGGFAALFDLPLDRYQKPALVSCTDGVGTKLKLAIDLNCHDHIGIDLVAMCVNDLITLGAEPLFFLDYFATGAIQLDTAKTIMTSIHAGCEQAHCALIGGETAECPGLYHDSDYDLAGFCVGIVEKDQAIDGRLCSPGDQLIGLAASGAHANGFSLIRNVIDRHNIPLDTRLPGSQQSLGSYLLTPTRIYVQSIQALLSQCPVHAMAHITGGGLRNNLARVLPNSIQAHINPHSWPTPALFQWLAEQGPIDKEEMHRVFNMGIGMVICVPATQIDKALHVLKENGETAWHIGELGQRSNNTDPVIWTEEP